jgi:hypothetical protein
MSDEVKTQLRLPAEMHAEIKRLADEDVRSLNAEIVVLLREALLARKGSKGESGTRRLMTGDI